MNVIAKIIKMHVRVLITAQIAAKASNSIQRQPKKLLLTATHRQSLFDNTQFFSRTLSSIKNSTLKYSQNHYSLSAVVSGFPKTQTNSRFNRELNGQIGEDAYFISQYNNINGLENEDLSKKNEKDSSESLSGNNADVIGVADGVGGWKLFGIDPSKFSRQLMQNCERLVESGQFEATKPTSLLAKAYNEMKKSGKQKVFGSSTACVTMVCHDSGTMYTANMGDSGLFVVRDGTLVHGTEEQTHCFNTPYQLSLPPPEHMEPGTLIDSPNDADVYKFQAQDGDIILLGTDGVFDNVDINVLLELINTIKGKKIDSNDLQKVCDAIALTAQELSRNENFLSPFARNAIYHGYRDMYGGKEDDISVILALVRMSHLPKTNK